MKKIITTTLAAGLVASMATAEVSTTFDFSSAYVFRGVTYNDGAVFQPGIEATGLGVPEAWGGLTVGAWGNYDFDDYDDTLPTSEFSEVDWYLSYSLPSLVDSLDLFLGYTEYTYPGVAGGADKEGNVGVGYGIAGIGLGYTLYFNVGNGDKYYYNEFAIDYGFEFTEELGASIYATAAYLSVDVAGAEDGFADGSLGGDISYTLSDVWSVGASVTYIAQLDDKVLPDAKYGAGYDVDLVGMLSLAASF
ncbi:MAG: hypothetical protein V3V05_11050 [Pontiella sp.]